MRTNAKAVIKRLEAKLLKAKSIAPKVLANEGQKFFLSNFAKQGWQGNGFQKWPARKDRKNKRPLLVGKTRKLINSIRRSVKEANEKRIVWGTSVPYAVTHNNGYRGVINRKAHKRNSYRTISIGGGIDRSGNRIRKSSRKMIGARYNVSGSAHRMRIPQRKFMGASPMLKNLLIKKAQQIYKDSTR